MGRWIEPVLILTCVCGALVGGCRDDLIDATPLSTPDTEVVKSTVDDGGEQPAEGEGAVEPTDSGPDAPGVGQDHESDAPEAVEESSGSAAAPVTRPQSTEQAPADVRDDRPATRPAPKPSPSAPAATSEAEQRPERAERPAARPRGGFEGDTRGADATRVRRGDLFEQHDANGDGLLQSNELPERFRERLMAADTNGDDALSAEELRQARPQGRAVRDASGWREMSPEERRERLMGRLDANGDGKIQVDELPERMRERMKQVDTNADGVLTSEEMEAAREAFRGGRRDGPAGGRDDFGGRRSGRSDEN